MAVYTEIGKADLEKFVAQYDIGDVISIKGIAEGVENSNFLLQTKFNHYILTIYEKRVKIEDLPFFLGLMDHLSKKGIPCPTPIRGRDGKSLRYFTGKPASIVTFLNGKWPKNPSPIHCASLGEHLARLHLAGLDFSLSRPNDLSVSGWKSLVKTTAERADEVLPGLAEEIETQFKDLNQLLPIDLPQGIIHADLFPDNVFFSKNKVSGLIDFYFACNDCLSYDLAVCLNAWCFEANKKINVTKAQQLLSAYNRIRRLEARELEVMPLLARGAAFRFLLTRLYDWLNQVEGALVEPKDPLEYLQKLRFHSRIDGVSAYGIS